MSAEISPSSKGAALVTGGARRIGRSIALALAKAGYDIALHYHSSGSEAAEIGRQIEALGRSRQLFSCDLNDTKQVRSLIPEVFKSLPHCNVLINNASIFQQARLLETDERIFERHWNINFKAPFFLTQDFARHCRSGQVINILDTKIVASHLDHFIYTLSKKALFEFTRMAAKELGPGIRVNGVSPGLILPPEGKDSADLDRKAAGIPLRRKGDLEELMAAVLFLVESPFITGDCIFVDGGEHLR